MTLFDGDPSIPQPQEYPWEDARGFIGFWGGAEGVLSAPRLNGENCKQGRKCDNLASFAKSSSC